MRSAPMHAPERRTYQLRLADVDTTDALTYLEGRAVPYEVDALVMGWYWERMAAQVFDAELQRHSGLPLLLWHNGRTWPVGVAQEWPDRDDGLHGVWRLDSSDEAQRAARMARDGFLTGLSVGFEPRTSTWTYTDTDTWNPDDAATYDRVTRVTARLAEVSLVPTPAYSDAQVSLVRSAERARRSGSSVGDRRRTASAAAAARPATPHLDYWRTVRDTLKPR